jgi:thiosulfate dehydrogenase [quinone] large subunit
VATIEIPEPKLSRLIFSDTRLAFIWLIFRLYVGSYWLMAGFDKLGDSVTFGGVSQETIQNFTTGFSQKITGVHSGLDGWYLNFIQHIVLTHAALFAYFVTYGEILMGVVLIVGIFTGIAAFLSAFLTLNYLFAGTIIIVNPIILFFEIIIILSWRTAGWYGLDRYILPAIGVPWQLGTLFKL